MGQYKMQISEKNGSFLNANQHEMQLKDSGVARVFFALWPEALVRQALHTLATEYQLRCEARAMRAETLHMTLLFLGGSRACTSTAIDASRGQFIGAALWVCIGETFILAA